MKSREEQLTWAKQRALNLLIVSENSLPSDHLACVGTGALLLKDATKRSFALCRIQCPITAC
jgi:hypothetical protein